MKPQITQSFARYLASLLLLLLVTAPFSSKAQIAVVWQDSFESPSVWSSWSVDNGVWEVGNPTTGPATNSAGYRIHDGTNCAATMLAGNYPASTSSRLIRTAFVVPSAVQNPRLEFWHWYSFGGSSYGVVQIKSGTNAWTDLSPRYYTSGGGVWTRPVVDLKAYAGKAVQIAFQIVADGSVGDGWDVDEVRVIKGDYTVGFTNGLTESFELGVGDWSAETGTWEVGVPTSGPATNALGWRAHLGTNCLATILGGDYTEDRSSRFVSPAFVVPADQPRLRFWHWFSIGAHDWTQVQIKVGTNAWQALSDQYYATSSGYWTRAYLDLSAYAGQTVQLGFYFESHSHYNVYGNYDSSVSSGWYVDDVVIETGTPPPASFPDGFETGWNGWKVDYIGGQATDFGIWQIGQPTSGPGAARTGTNCAATILTGNYPEDRSGRLFSQPFVVPVDQPRLRFWHWFSIGAHDWTQVQIKVGTNAWQALSDQYYATSSGYWTRAYLDLSAYAGQTVQLGFYFESHSHYNVYGNYDSSVSSGWYVDDVVIETGTPPPASFPDGFETGWNGWKVDYIGGQATDFGIWQIGQPTSGPGAARTGTNCAATILTGNYPEDRSGRLFSQPFVVPVDQPRLRFWHWFSIGAHDWTQVQIKVGTNAWQALSDQYYATSSGYWTRAYLDLSAYAGQTVQLGFYFESHSHYNVYGNYDSSVSSGWYVDDVVIETGTPPPASFPDGFETGWNGWKVDYIGGQATDFGIWQIGQPTSGPGAARTGTNCAATILTGNYPEDRSGRLFSQPFVVPDVGAHPNLRFWHWFNIGAHDFCQLQIKTPSSSWQVLAQYSGGGAVWSQPSFDLSAYAGQTVQLAFYFESQSHYNIYGNYDSSVGPGWYVDDVQINSTTPPTGIVEFKEARYFVTEAETSVAIAVERKYGTNGAVDVSYMVTDGSAVSPDDYDADVNTLSWADGEQGVKTINVQIHQDALVEGNETVTLELFVPGAVASSVARLNSNLVIVDDDGVLPLVTNIAYLRSLVGTTNYVPTNTTNLFNVEGTVTTYTNLSSTAADELFFMQDNTNGIAVLFRGGTNQFMPQMGDLVRVTAALTNINGLLALAPNYANITNYVWRLSSSNALPALADLDFATRTNVPTMESLEARYVRATNVWVSQTDGAFFPTTLANVALTNAEGLAFDLTIHPNLTNAGQIKPTGPVTIVGVLSQNDSTSPYTTNYSLIPTEIQGGNPGVVQFTVSAIKALESVTTVTLTATRTVASNGPINNVTFGMVNGSALAGIDYVATNGVFSWADGEGGPKSITVQLLNDSSEEVDKFLSAQLSGAVVGVTNTVVVTIVNDDFVATPASQALPQGANTSLSITPTASAFGYQWWKDGVLRANATNSILALTNVQIADGGNYSAVITTTAGVVTSTVAQVVIAVPVSITQQPLSQTALAGSYVSLTVGVSGTTPYTYQWRRNGVNLSEATNVGLVFNSVQVSDAADYSVVVNNPANVPTNSAVATLTVFGGGFVPAGAGLGDYTVNNGLFTINAGGEDIEGTEDRFFFVYTPLVGDGQIITRLIGLTPADPQSEAGVMLRDGSNGGSRHAFVAFDASKNNVFRRRLVENDYSVETPYRGTNMPWMRLSRMGDTFIGHYSTNGVNWDLVWWTTIVNMPTTLEAGLAVTAHKNGGTATALFTNVSVGPLMPLSGVWPLSGPQILLGGEGGGMTEFQRVGGFKVLVGGAVGDRFAVRATGDLTTPFASWLQLGTVTNTYGVVPFKDAQALTNQQRFYRATVLSP